MKKILLFLIACALGFVSAEAQTVSMYHSAFYTDDGSVLGYPAGHTTYRLYVDLENATDFLQAVWAAGANPLTIGTDNANVWNSPFGGQTANACNPIFFGGFPSLQYDSFVTIGRLLSTDAGADVSVVETLPGTAFADTFHNGGAPGGNAAVVDGAWTTLNPAGVNHLGTGPNNTVVVAQITTDGEPNWQVNLQIFDPITGLGAYQLVWDDTNVDPGAVVPQYDGSCMGLEYPADPGCFGVDGCTSTTACNYNSLATNDDGSCIEPDGCTSTTACNYNSLALCDDGSCIEPDGCTDSGACNYDSLAVCDDGSCIFPPANDLCAGAIAVGVGTTNVDNTGTCNNEVFGIPLVGCTAQGGWCAGEGDEQTGVWFTFTTGPDPAVHSIEMSDDGSGSFDTQVAVFDGCGGALVGANDDAGAGLFSLVTFDCGVLAANTTYWILVDGWGGEEGTADMTITEDTAPCAAQPGCTDSLACNYDSLAAGDDGSCCYDNCVNLEVTDGANSGEISWELYDGALLIAFGGAPADVDLCLAAGCYDFVMYDSFGDGWDGGQQYIFTGGASATGTLANGSGPETVTIGVGGAVAGCTDSLACNYNPAAVCDDGSCASDNDEPGCAPALAVSPLGSCNSAAGSLLGATPSAAAGNVGYNITGEDRWHSFVAQSPGAAIQVTTADFDCVIVLQNASAIGTLVTQEDVVFVNGSEIMNVGNLIEGDTYLIGVQAWNGFAGNGDYGVCVENLPDTRCDLTGTFNLCSTFKADWVGTDDYLFNFVAQSDAQLYQHQSGFAYTFVQLFTVANLPWGDTYDVAINSIYNRVDGNGSADVVIVDNNEPCVITINPQPLAQMNPGQNCSAGPQFPGAYVPATPWICGAVDWTWEFTRTDVAELPFEVQRGSSNRYFPLALASLVPGATYDVRTKPEFANAAVTTYGPVQCLQIIGPAGEPPVTGAPAVETAEEKGLDATGPVAAIYPNPNNGDVLNINLVNVQSDIITVDIYDGFGKLVQAQQLTVAGGNVNEILSLNDMASGMYTVRITMDDTVQTEKLIIQK